MDEYSLEMCRARRDSMYEDLERAIHELQCVFCKYHLEPPTSIRITPMTMKHLRLSTDLVSTDYKVLINGTVIE